jgi:hypothetical protein
VLVQMFRSRRHVIPAPSARARPPRLHRSGLLPDSLMAEHSSQAGPRHLGFLRGGHAPRPALRTRAIELNRPGGVRLARYVFPPGNAGAGNRGPWPCRQERRRRERAQR